MNTTTLNMTTLDGGVIIKKGTAPAPPSGGESASNMEYWDISAFSDEEKPILLQFCAMMVCIQGSGVVSPYAILGGVPLNRVNKIATIPSFEIGSSGDMGTIAQIIEMQGWATRIQRIPKEQFYSLD